MERPLEIAFHNMPPSTEIEAMIRQHVDKLQTRFAHLTGCRVSVEALHQQHRTGNPYEVHIVLSVPGRDLAVSREQHHSRENQGNPEIHAAVRDAFRAAETQLRAYRGRMEEDASGPSGSALAARIMLIEPGADHGYLQTPTGTQLYFHRDSVTSGAFDDLKAGDPVHYVEEEGGAGPVATKVRIATT